MYRNRSSIGKTLRTVKESWSFLVVGINRQAWIAFCDVAEASDKANEPDNPEPGWYDYAGGLRLWNGERWTDQYAPPPPPPAERINYRSIAGAAAIGMVIGWFVIWALAQAWPETFYWPVKFVVEELPEGF